MNVSFPADILDMHVEVLINNVWTDVISDVQGDKQVVTINRGSDVGLGKVQPSDISFILNNFDGRYSPRNPTGPYYGLLQRNPPVRVLVYPHFTAGSGMDDTDTFTRTVSSAWGNSDGGNTYIDLGAGGTVLTSDWSVSSGKGNHYIPAVASYRCSALDLALTDVDVYATFDTSVANVTGGVIEPGNIMLRVQYNGSTFTDYYLARVEVSTAEVVTARLMRASGTVSLASVTVPTITWTAQPLRVRARVLGITLYMKVWDPAVSGEPDAWTLQVDDYTLTTPGGVGFRSGIASGNTNIPCTFTWDDVSIVAIFTRIFGEIPEWPTTLKQSTALMTTKVQASGIMRRLNQGSKVIRSPLQRKYLDMSPVIYWALDDGPDADFGGSTITAGAQSIFAITGLIELSKVAGPTGAPANLPQMAQNISASAVALAAHVTEETTSSYTIDLCILASHAPSATSWSYTPITWSDTNGNTFTLVMAGSAYAHYITAWGYTVSALNINAQINWDVVDGKWHHIRIEVELSGSTTTISLLLDDLYYATDSEAGFIASDITNVGILNNLKAEIESASIGHIGIFTGVGLTTTYQAFLGYPAETISTRTTRLAAQDDIAIIIADDGSSPLLGPQRTVAIMDMLVDVQSADLGVLTEARNAYALNMRTLNNLYDTAPVTLSHTLHHFSSGLRFTDDDALIWNSVTVQRYNGTKQVKQKLTGPLNIQPFPYGVGMYDRGAFTTHIAYDSDVLHVASWLVELNTRDEVRYTLIPINLARSALATNPTLCAQIAMLDVGDIITLTGLPSTISYNDVHCMIVGYTEKLTNFGWTIDFYTVPAGNYLTVGIYDDTDSRYAPTYSELATSINTTETTLSISVTGIRWVRAADDATSLPFDIIIGGERMTVTAVTGTSSPQSFTVTRSINGVVKSHTAGALAEVRLFQETCYGK